MVSANQGSRGGIITVMVIACIGFLTTGILAIYFYAESNKSLDKLDTLQKKYNTIIADAQIQSADITDLEQIKNDEALGFNASMKAVDVLIKQRDDLATRLVGSPGYRDAMTRSKTSLEQKLGGAEGQPIGNDAVTAIETLLKHSAGAAEQIAKLESQLEQSNAEAKAAKEELAAAAAKMQEQLAAVRAEADKTIDESKIYSGSKDEIVKKLEEDFNAKATAAQEAQAALNVQIADLNKQLEQAKLQYQNLQQKLGSTRVNTADATVRAADGIILRVVSRDVVYINLGAGDQISPGLTFQVYDRVEGVPPIGENAGDENLPRGKASIEVVRVGAGSSECRVIRAQPGYTVIEGDLVANLVYDRNTKYTFTVYGNFDLDQNEVPTPADTEVIRRLATQWGGKVSDKVTVETDFLVMGIEPQVPTFTREELDDAINAARYAEAVAALEAYLDVLRQARELNIPVLNQNRFLYYVGYFEMSKR